MSRFRVALVTTKQSPTGFEDTSELITALQDREASVDVVIWNDETVSWKDYDSVFLHAPWDYMDHFDSFRNWIETIRLDVSLVNPAQLISWNLDKRYLLQLEKNGVSIPPTVAYDYGNQIVPAELSKIFGNNQSLVVKAAVSAGGRGTWLCSTPKSVEVIVKRELPNDPVIIQIYQPTIEKNGEYSAIYFDGALSHVIHKMPKIGEFKVQSHYGGSEKLVPESSWMTEYASRVLSALPEPARYARIDFLVDQTGEPKLMEIELIEPDLFLRYKPESYKKLAKLIVP